MKALLWKEWRENLKWAVLALLAGGALWWYVLHRPPWPDSIMSSHAQVAAAFFAAVSAVLLGALQTFLDTRSGRRALLLHRPLSRSRIFFAKACAGLSLYFLAVSVPFAGAALWIAVPGHVGAPFRWAMVLPGAADILVGAVYYFAGMLVIQREARWYGSRALPLAGAFVFSMLVAMVPEFWHALLICAGGVALAATAAWGSFLTGGAYPPQPQRSRLALATLLLAGLLIGGTVLVSLLHQLVVTQVSVIQQLDKKGHVVTVRYVNHEPPKVTDAEGHALPEFENKPVGAWEGSAPAVYFVNPTYTLTYRNPQRLFTYDYGQPGHWLYVRDERRMLIYEYSSHRLLGRVGPDGFTPEGEPGGKPFEGDLLKHISWANEYLVFPRAVYKLEGMPPTIRILFKPAPGETVEGAHRWQDGNDKDKAPVFAFVLTDRAFRALDDASGKEVFSAPLAYPYTEYWIEAARLEGPTRYVLWYRPTARWGVDTETLPSHLVSYAADGRELARQTVPPLPLEIPLSRAVYGLVTPTAGALAVLGIYYLATGLGPIGSTALILTFGALMLFSALAAAAACGVLARRYAFSHAAAAGWTSTGLLFGPAGLLLMLAVQQWPARVACPACCRLRVVDREQCEHCGALHTAPAPDGTEIFEPAPTEPHAAPAV
jgi:4-hydroxy-3-methylbut-2-en-1-yl diphosphate synthase IspG/GcpE